MNARSEFDALIALSARVGSDPLLVQGAGGNTSIKDDGVMWIKASGTWLKHAADKDIMVPVRLAPLLDALERDDPATEKAQDFVVAERNPSGLRPSIETTVHALMPQKVVVHVHCVETISHAVRIDGSEIVFEKLKGFETAFVPYARPGLPLAKAISSVMRDGVNVLVLGNHGLVVAADTVADAEDLLARICSALAHPPRPTVPADLETLNALADGSDYELPQDDSLHQIATDPDNCRIAAGGTLYPDHVVFLGVGNVVAEGREPAAVIAASREAMGASKAQLILYPGLGVLTAKGISQGAVAMARCLADVSVRIPADAPLRYLSDAENAELTNWDAEKYRQALNKAKAD